MTALYEPFLATLSPGALILDVGCGSGRDSLAFLRRGFRVTALEPCEALAAHAEMLLGQPVTRQRAQKVNAEDTFDGIWACASLLHVPASETPAVLARLARALRPGGVLYVSYKLGRGERVEDGRFFHDLTEEAVRRLLEAASFAVDVLWVTDDARPGRSQRWVNALARREAS
ncbi:MAG: class I SAM-dependent methyltransferase [Myxococcaceae bacterium]|nr:MAG: class I SAM-dependent methyltransferase [Myxococcaceae bacterium]